MKKVEGEIADDDPRIGQEQLISALSNPDCPKITDGMEAGATYEFEEDSWYRVADRWAPFVDWVVTLADLVGLPGKLPEPDSTIAFRDIFLYLNHGGTFGPVASKKLAEDFALWDERALALEDKDFYDLFRLMRNMFEFAAEGGACWLRCW
ncbi:hypothetical protein PQR66_24220 [Paraburkholderia agricolaris]|uniref:Uncharacterized protein n=1 Tax=Paraburkholderia agricolaris TaxID=2152888 RepID=A0ABW8ZV18_9BURK